LATFGKVEFWSCDQVFVTTIGSRPLEDAYVSYWALAEAATHVRSDPSQIRCFSL